MLDRLVVTMLCGCLAAQTQSPPERAAIDLLPTSTYAVLRFGGLGACARDASDLPLGALVQGCLQRLPDDVRAQRVEGPLDAAARGVQQTLAAAGIAPADVADLLRRPLLLAVGRLTIEGMGPSLCVVLELGTAAAAFDRCVAAGCARLRTELPGVVVTPLAIGGLVGEEIQLPGGPRLWLGTVAGHAFLSNSRGYLQELAAVARGEAASLGAAWRRHAPAGREPLAALMVDGQRIMASLAPHLPYEAAAFADALGVGAPQAVYAGLAGGLDSLRLEIGGDAHGIAKVLLAAPADLGFARACSPNTVAFAAGSLDLAGVLAAWQSLLALLPAAARESVRRDFGREAARALRRAGIAPPAAAALVRALAPQVAVALALERGVVPKPELLLRIGVRDAATVAAALQRLETATAADGMEWRTRKAGAHTIRFCNLRLADDGLQVAPCYVLHDDSLWCASDPAALARALRQAETGDDSLADQPDFVDLVQASAGASGVLHLRLFRAVELGWREVETWAYPRLDARRAELGFGREVLPDADEASRALGTVTLQYRIDDVGVALDHRGAFTVGTWLAGLGAVADAVLARAARRTD
jgi:hypothetical protein